MEQKNIRTGSLNNTEEDRKEAATASHQPTASGAAGRKMKAMARCLGVPLTSESCFEKFFLKSPGETPLPVAVLQNKVTRGMFGLYLENSQVAYHRRQKRPSRTLKAPRFDKFTSPNISYQPSVTLSPPTDDQP